MTRLIHLNGPSRVGKTTLARRYADDHPGTVVVDVDTLTLLVGGWRDDFGRAWTQARTLALTLAGSALRAGHDVVLPQLVTIFDRDAPGFEPVAADAGAEYVEIALLVDPDEHRQRVDAKQPVHEVEAAIQEALMDPAVDRIARIRGHLAEYLATRPDTIRLDTSGLDVETTYARLCTALHR